MGRMNGLFQEPKRDRVLGEALRQIESGAGLADAEILRRRIVAAARSRLAELARPAPRWWEMISGWSRVAVPVGLAASLAAGLLVQGSVTGADSALSAGELGADSTLVIAAFSEPSSGRLLTAHLIAPEGSDWLLEQAVTQ
jgi:hypothetical protein